MNWMAGWDICRRWAPEETFAEKIRPNRVKYMCVHVYLKSQRLNLKHPQGNRTTEVHSCTLQGWKFHIHSHINVDDFIADLQWKTPESSVWEGGHRCSAPFLSDLLLIHCQQIATSTHTLSCQSLVEPTLCHRTGFFYSCFICIWQHKCHPFWARCSSAGPVKDFRIDWFFFRSTPSLLPFPTPTQPATHPASPLNLSLGFREDGLSGQ